MKTTSAAVDSSRGGIGDCTRHQKVVVYSAALLLLICTCAWAQSTTPGPALSQSTLLAGMPAQSMALDAAGNRYVGGYTGVSKLAPDGTTTIWANKISATYTVRIGLDANGNVYAFGSCSTACATPTNTFGNNLKPGGTVLLLWKLDPAGDTVYVDQFSDSSATANDIAVGSDGTVAITGRTQCGFPTSAGTVQPVCPTGSSSQAFVAKVSPSGALLYATYLGGGTSVFQPPTFVPVTDSTGMGVAIDSSGAIYVTGTTYVTDFPTTSGSFMPTYPSAPADVSDIGSSFLAKLDASGSKLVYSTFLVGGATSLALDGSGNAYVTGYAPRINASTTPNRGCVYLKMPTTAGVAEPDYPSDFSCVSLQAGSPGFSLKMNAAGSGLIYCTYLHIIESGFYRYRIDQTPRISVDGTGNAYVYGQTMRTKNPLPVNAVQNNPLTGSFIVELNTGATQYLMQTGLGTVPGAVWTFPLLVSSLVPAADGSVYVAGTTQYHEFPATAVVGSLANINQSGFIGRIAASGPATPYLYPQIPLAALPPSTAYYTLALNTLDFTPSGNYGSPPIVVGSTATATSALEISAGRRCRSARSARPAPIIRRQTTAHRFSRLADTATSR